MLNIGAFRDTAAPCFAELQIPSSCSPPTFRHLTSTGVECRCITTIVPRLTVHCRSIVHRGASLDAPRLTRTTQGSSWRLTPDAQCYAHQSIRVVVPVLHDTFYTVRGQDLPLTRRQRFSHHARRRRCSSAYFRRHRPLTRKAWTHLRAYLSCAEPASLPTRVAYPAGAIHRDHGLAGSLHQVEADS
ncbi:hypothetical protein HYPSUDRAFT_207787 [Hypholoma sublateritium FD-334 SS-4]|uniref:Uncharacterized protein n=1 Tax=Hypholoma sublateritium (strain FD-334 SS-4) TaxID=945553 RepID=A0A0D2P4X9_HYPSF|nr:hypothetical protein HYPSUDRAFT_207787 [Hypholoma sublateritium FD-334 SS-4]